MDSSIVDQDLVLGACCICEKEDDTVRNMIALHFKAPVLGTGWGCFKCDQPSNGAMVVICDECLEANQGTVDSAIKYVIYGYPAKKQRIDIAQVDQDDRFEHDTTKHVDEFAHLN